ncbi:sensor histidine kinase [Marinitenerispora sediminis]|uniref:histidine kinase n=2 Tax=Marinitenerispora sediminis TaxID=1931232 RepID=A0A368TAE6_9ACTN|nr:sensor histidine kinase [Marinitenerispora sediminis]RCV60489.1 sensor histidine kinase [Marinitenerispora sediminis]RCV61861.1 sensor histidine kinase [Marinitenerispora sediminis]
MVLPIVLAVSATASGLGPGAWVDAGAAGVVLGGAVALSRRWTVAALCVTLAAALVQLAVRGPGDSGFPFGWPLVATALFGYLAGHRLPRARPVLLAAAGAAAVAVLGAVARQVVPRGAFGVLAGLHDGIVVALALLLMLGVPWMAGRYRRQHAELAAAGWQRAELLERQQRIAAEQARLRERARIAQDMHDSLGHELSLVALRAAALQVAPDLDERHRAAVRELRSGIADATERLRDIIGVLRPDGDPAPAAPTPEDVDVLVSRARSSGLVVELHRTGEAAEPPAAVERAVHRVVQEGLTNAAKHAPGAAVLVLLEQSAGATAVTVSNGPPSAPAPAASGGRQGLVGLRERVRLAGGTLRSGPRGSGFELAAVLPHRAAPARAAADGTDDASLPDSGEDPPPATTGAARHASGRRIRRGLRRTLVGLTLAGSTAVVAALGIVALTGLGNRLDADIYEGLRVGERRAAVERRLPPSQIVGVPVAEPPAPRGATCRYYWPSHAGDDTLYYRLCFDEHHLVAKDAVPREALSPAPAPRRPADS